MKFSLFAISAVALCLLQQSQASPLVGGSQDLTGGVTGGALKPVTDLAGGLLGGNNDAGNVGNGVIGDESNTVVGKGGSGSAVAPVDGENNIGDLTGQDVGDTKDEAKRDLLGLDELVGSILEEIDGLLEGLTGTVGAIDIAGLNLEGLVGGIVDTVRSLLKEDGLVGGLLKTVTGLLEAVLELLDLLGISDVADLSAVLDDLLGSAGGIAKRGATTGITGGNSKTVNIDAVKGVLEKIKAILSGLTSSGKGGPIDGLLGGLLKSVLDLVKGLLGGVTSGGAANTGALRRALIKRAIERRAAL